MASSEIDLKDHFKNGYALVIDDSAGMRRTLRAMLRQAGVADVVAVGDGDMALEALNSKSNCRFVFVDWNMPRVSGINVVRELRADNNFQDVPILMITGEAGHDEVAEAAEAGVDGYIVKPFGVKTLEDKLTDIIYSRENPTYEVTLLKKGRELTGQGEFAKAFDVLKKANSIRPCAKNYVAIGDLYDAMGDLGTAHDCYETGISLNPLFLQAYMRSANLHLKQGNKDAALVKLAKAAEISPSFPDRHIVIGKIYLEKGNERLALKSFDNAARISANKAEEIAGYLFDSGKIKLSVQYFRLSLRKNGENTTVYNKLGIALRRLGSWKDAVNEFRIALKIDPEDVALYFNMGKAYQEGGMFGPAQDAFSKALELNPGLREAQNALKELDGNTVWETPSFVPEPNSFRFPNWLAATIG